MRNLKVDFYKCRDCQFQSTLISEAQQHAKPLIKDGKLQAGHSVQNMRDGSFVN